MPGREWVRPASTIAAGVLAAAALGKIGPVSAQVGRAFGLSPFALGATISLITFVGAVVAAPAGQWLRDRDPRPWLAAGLAVMAVAGGAMILAPPSRAALICLRAVEGAGYLLIVVGGPAVLVQQVSAARARAALALWGVCTPAGLAVSAAAGGLAASRAGWQDWFAALAVACAVLAGVVLVLARGQRGAAPAAQPADRRRLPLAAPVLLACGFGALSLMAVAILSLLPTYLIQRGLPPAVAGAATAAAAAASIPGNASAAALLRRGVRPGLLTCSMLACPALAAVTFARAVPLPAAVAGAAALIFAVGITASAAYASLPEVTRSRHDLPLANGILIQLGSVGALIGPPVFAAVTGLHHWLLIAYLAVPAAIAGAAAMNSATLARRRQAGGASRS